MRLSLDFPNVYNNNNNTLIYIAPACRMTSEALKPYKMRKYRSKYPLPVWRLPDYWVPLWLWISMKTCMGTYDY